MNLIDDIIARETAPYYLPLCIHDVSMALRSNNGAAVQALRRQYGRYVEKVPATPRFQIWLLDLDPARYMPADRSAFQCYVLPSGRGKDPFLDEGEIRYVANPNGRYAIFDDQRYVVFGIIDRNNQLHNIINAIHMREMVARGYTIVHGAGLEIGEIGFGLVGRAGTGKTTTMLKIVAAGGTYVSNDRLIVRREPNSDWFEMRGVVKWPRVCAGTMHGDSRLRELLPAEAIARYDQMSFDELFEFAEKYDLDVESTYGAGRVKDTSRFRRIYCLAWSRQQEGFAIERVDTRTDAFWDDFGPSLAKDAGVFDGHQRSSLWNADRKDCYRRGLDGIELFAITGKLHFERIAGALLDHLKQTG